MKKTSIFFGLMALGFFASAQTRLSLYEEFTGENCPPCASTNPGLDLILGSSTNTALTTVIKWQVAIPSAPSTTWSLYQTNSSEINTRMNYYSVNSAPNGRMDGQSQVVFGASSDHPANWANANISNAQAISTPFSITMNPNWDGTFSNAAVTITLTSSSTFTATNLRLRLVLIEKQVNFNSAPGTNGEKDFHWAARKSYPDITNGTALLNSWTAAQTQTFTINCAVPSYVNDKSQMGFVVFVQDDGNKKIWQSARTAPLSIPNDAKLSAYTMAAYSCSNSIVPTVSVVNQGPNAITALTITPVIDGVSQTAFNWTGSLASMAGTNIPLGSYAAASGNHTVNFNISGVSGGDVNTSNNAKTGNTALIQTYFTGPVAEAFPSNPFPPANWFMINTDGGASWSRSGSAGYNGAGAAKYDFFTNATIGDADDLFITPSNLTGTTAPMMSFDVAYAQYASENDKLEVKVSTDCGQSWTTAFNKAGTVLKTVAAQTSAFTPNNNAQWRNETFALPAAAANNAQVLVKFVATSAYGNNLYVDNVNISQNSIGIKTHNPSNFNVVLYPNPSSEMTNLDINSKGATKGTIAIYNAIGQLVYSNETKIEDGYNNVKIDTKALPAGIYNVTFNSDLGSFKTKLTIAK
jgi:hypothetical protein